MTRTFNEAVETIESWLERLEAIYEEDVEPGVSDDSVLEAEIDTLNGVRVILKEVYAPGECPRCGHCLCGECSIRGEAL